MESRESLITSDSILLFDFDGTLVETDYANFLAYDKAVKLVKNISIPYGYVKRFNRSCLTAVIPNLTEEEYCRIIREKENFYDLFLHTTKLNFGITKILCHYFSTNKTVLVTNSRKDRALKTLSYHGLLDKFSDFVFCGENDIFHNKFLKALENLQLPVDKVVLFEDDALQLQCAKTVGIRYFNPIIF